MAHTTRPKPIPDAADEHTIFALLDAAHALEARLEAALGRAGLSSPKFAVLSALVDAHDPVALGELASKLSCVRSNMTQLVDRLEAEGLVQRVDCPADRRSVKAEITQAGRERQRAAAAELAQFNRDFQARVRAEDSDVLARLLGTLR